MVMLNHGCGDPYDDDEQFYRETVYNEDYYIEQEKEALRQSNLEFELERLEDEYIIEVREVGLSRPVLIQSFEIKTDQNAQIPVNSSDGLGDLPF